MCLQSMYYIYVRLLYLLPIDLPVLLVGKLIVKQTGVSCRLPIRLTLLEKHPVVD
jgi:hypothetical protein